MKENDCAFLHERKKEGYKEIQFLAWRNTVKIEIQMPYASLPLEQTKKGDIFLLSFWLIDKKRKKQKESKFEEFK